MFKDIDVYNYLRHEKKFPLMWCAGCGNGIILGSIIRAVDTLGLDKNKMAMEHQSASGQVGQMRAATNLMNLGATWTSSAPQIQ